MTNTTSSDAPLDCEIDYIGCTNTEVTIEIDPFDREIHQVEREVAICPECYQQRFRDI